MTQLDEENKRLSEKVKQVFKAGYPLILEQVAKWHEAQAEWFQSQLEEENKRLREKVKQLKAERALILERVAVWHDTLSEWFRHQAKLNAIVDSWKPTWVDKH